MKGEVKAKLAKVYPPRRAAVTRLFLVRRPDFCLQHSNSRKERYADH